jgi:phospholipid/cholesterol/gamma-HCH transport system ATP-binding protein
MTDFATRQVPAIELREVTRSFGRNAVLRGVDLVVQPGRTLTILGGSGSGKSVCLLTILGGSGSGKSVCLKHMIGLMRPDSGRVLVEGVDITEYRESQLIDVRKNVSMVFQGAALFDSLDVYENVAYPLREHWRAKEEEIAARVARCLDAVGLPGVERLLPSELSGGMRKRVGVARAIALEPRVILYDEPTTGLDPANQRRIGELIRDLQERRRADPRSTGAAGRDLGGRDARTRAVLRRLGSRGAPEERSDRRRGHGRGDARVAASRRAGFSGRGAGCSQPERGGRGMGRGRGATRGNRFPDGAPPRGERAAGE